MGLAQFELLFKLRNQRLEHHLVTKVDDLRRQRKILLRRRFEFFAEDVITHQGKNLLGPVGEFPGWPTQRTLQRRRMTHDLGQILVLRAQRLLHLGNCRRDIDTHLRRQFLLGQHPRTARPGDAHRLKHRRHLADHGIHEIVGIHFRVERQLSVVSNIDHEHQRLVDHLRMALDVVRRCPRQPVLADRLPVIADDFPCRQVTQLAGQGGIGRHDGIRQLLFLGGALVLHRLIAIENT